MRNRGFFAYFPVPPGAQKWEIYATSFGHVRMTPNASAYPPDRHPEGRHFVWEDGRILPDCQLLFIHSGSGDFESTRTRRIRLSAGTVLILSPGVWHRYRPTPGTGWTESWLELRGEQMNRLIKNGIVDPRRSVFHRPLDDSLERAWERARQTAWTKPPNFPVRLGLIALEILVLLQEKPAAPHVPRPIEAVVSQAQTRLSEGGPEDVSIATLARQLGVGYSYFRRSFKRQTGFSPKQYRNEVRFRRTKELLAHSSLSIKEISLRLGYNSPYHLTKDFTMRAKAAPSVWRRSLAEGAA